MRRLRYTIGHCQRHQFRLLECLLLWFSPMEYSVLLAELFKRCCDVREPSDKLCRLLDVTYRAHFTWFFLGELTFAQVDLESSILDSSTITAGLSKHQTTPLPLSHTPILPLGSFAILPSSVPALLTT
ncbi:hypothetical protein Pelo_4255 [Pelomyxa schiedti]|nr:hypothetical protein Pelo_4255 [Pelomyxa schiedti]